jgi:glycosyltransferase involved in cell wall biosynthesis
MTVGNTIDVLVPTCDRPAALAITLTALSAQNFPGFRIIIADQSEDQSACEAPEVAAVLRFLNLSGREVQSYRHLPRRGMAEQRSFLLSKVTAPYCLFLDDDVILESDLIARLHHAITSQRCGFVGSALHGLGFADDIRPEQQHIEFWTSEVLPELVTPESPAWDRHHLHSAANLLHVQMKLGIDRQTTRLYRVAWVGGCVLFDTWKLRAVGGFDFWHELPVEHCGEDVLAQLRVMEQFGGCGIIPSGAYHLELPTTIRARRVDAPKVLPISSTARTDSASPRLSSTQCSTEQQ